MAASPNAKSLRKKISGGSRLSRTIRRLNLGSAIWNLEEKHIAEGRAQGNAVASQSAPIAWPKVFARFLGGKEKQ